MKVGLSVFITFLLVLGGCTRNEIKLSFEVSQGVNTPCRIVYYASDKRGGMMRETVVEISAGKSETTLPQRNPSLIYLFSPASKFPDIIIYGERGDKFKITGDSENIQEWKVSGNKTTDELTEWRLANAEILKGRDKEKLNAAVASYVDSHPDSRASAIILYVYFTRRGHEKEFSALESKIDKDIMEDADLMGALSQGDLLTGLSMEPRYPPMIVLHGEEGYADTLRTASGSEVMLLFRANYDNTVSNDSIESLAKRKGYGVIAEIYVETDSSTWRRHVKQDSLPGVKRLWMPLGLADSLALEMDIRRLPYYVVFDAQGKETYRGDDWKAAAATYSK